MISFKDLENKVYSDRVCVRFECTVKPDEEHWTKATFRRDSKNANQWNMQVIIDRTRDKDSEIYNFGYILPKDTVPLELVAATGFRYFQLYLKEEVQLKSNLDFALGEIINGVMG